VNSEFADALGPDGHRIPLQKPTQQVVGRGVHDVVVAVVPAGLLLVGGDDLHEVHLQPGLLEVPGAEGMVEMHVAGSGEDTHRQLSGGLAGRAERAQRGEHDERPAGTGKAADSGRSGGHVTTVRPAFLPGW